MPFLGIGGNKPTYEEMQEKNQYAEVELSYWQKQMAIKKLKEAGLTKKSFGSWGAIWNWVKTH